MYSSGAHVFLFLLFLANQNSGGEAGPCKIHYRTDTREWLIGGTSYTCVTYNVPYCKGGCAAEIKYDLHVSDSLSSNRRCSADVNQCVENGEGYKDLENCVYTIDNTTVSPSPGVITVPTACTCSLVHGSSTSGDVCETKLSQLLL